MIPNPGNTVVLFFRNGTFIEGEVISWSDDKTILRSLTGSSTIVINKTVDDVMYLKISSAKNEYEKLKNKPRKEEDDIRNLAALKVELNEIERAEIREKLKDHTSDGMRKINYELPYSNIKVQGSVERSPKETSRENSDISSGLQDLFSKKY